MSQRKSRRLRAEHLLPYSTDQRDIDNLLDSLNDDEYENCVEVREMLRNMNAVTAVTEQKAVPNDIILGVPGWQTELRKHGFDKSFARRMESIRDKFDGSKVNVRTSFPTKGRWRFNLELPPTRNKSELSLLIDVLIIRHLAEDGRFRLIRECETCGRWFIAHRPNAKYRFHSNACRDKFWRKTPEGKAKRKVFMQDYRKRIKRREEALKKFGRFTKRKMS